jgi:hypothetical protein
MDRPKLFEESDLGLEQFAPVSADKKVNVSAETVRQMADAGGFPSRGPFPSTRREPLVYRSGRTASFSVKTMPSTVDSFYAIARERGWKAGETFERAVEALLEQLK